MRKLFLLPLLLLATVLIIGVVHADSITTSDKRHYDPGVKMTEVQVPFTNGQPSSAQVFELPPGYENPVVSCSINEMIVGAYSSCGILGDTGNGVAGVVLPMDWNNYPYTVTVTVIVGEDYR